MAERLTEIGMFINTPTYIIKNGKKSEAVDKLAQLEDIMEKYGIESVEELEKILGWLYTLSGKDIELMKFIAQERKQIHDMYCEIKKDRDTWQKACELACEKLNDCFNDEQIENGFCYRVDNFYQQAKNMEKKC